MESTAKFATTDTELLRPAPTDDAVTTHGRILALEGITKSFGSVRALDGVRLEVHAGEVLALVGDNGAGKSTLIKILSGVYAPDHGSVSIAGRAVELGNPGVARALGIATVFQDLALCDNLDVVANLFLGREMGKLRNSEEEMEKSSLVLLEELAAKIPSVRAPVAGLSGGQRQAIAIARALIGNPRLVLLDEPTAALGVAQTAEVLSLIHRLRERGLGIILISHNMADVFSVADRIAVLRLGRNNGHFDAAGTDSEQIISAITGATLYEQEAAVVGQEEIRPHHEH